MRAISLNDKRSSRSLSGRVSRLLGLVFLLVLIIVPVTVGHAKTVITVNWSTDDKQGSDGACTLREAIVAASTDKESGGKPGAGQVSGRQRLRAIKQHRL